MIHEDLNKPLLTLVGWPNFDSIPKGDVGIELEIEGDLGELRRNVFVGPEQPETFDNQSVWGVKNDGSLREMGVEYVNMKPISLEVVREHLQWWVQHIERYNIEIEPTIRTSSHVHFNARNLTGKDFAFFLVAWALAENALIASQGPDREGNLYCLPVDWNETVWVNLLNGFQTHQWFNGFSSPHKYAALNMNPLTMLGSVEARFFRGMETFRINDFAMLIDGLHHMLHQTGTLFDSATQIIEQYEEDYTLWMAKVFGTSKIGSFIAEESGLGFLDFELYHKPLTIAYEMAEAIDFSGRELNTRYFSYVTPDAKEDPLSATEEIPDDTHPDHEGEEPAPQEEDKLSFEASGTTYDTTAIWKILNNNADPF